MAKINVTLDLDWIDGEEFFDDELKERVFEEAKNVILKYPLDEINKKVEAAITEKLKTVEEEIDKSINNYLASINSGNIDKLKIAQTANSWSDEVEIIPIREYIGKKFEEYCVEKRYNKDFEETQNYRDKKYSLIDKDIQNYLKDTLTPQIEKIVKNARVSAEKEIVKSFETTLRNNLVEDMIQKMNIPQALENLQKMSMELVVGAKDE